jgi:hypothetical protein
MQFKCNKFWKILNILGVISWILVWLYGVHPINSTGWALLDGALALSWLSLLIVFMLFVFRFSNRTIGQSKSPSATTAVDIIYIIAILFTVGESFLLWLSASLSHIGR